MHNPEFVLKNEILEFLDTNGSLNLSQKTRLRNNQQEKNNLLNSRLCCPSCPLSKRKKTKRKISTSTLPGNWKKNWNMKVTIIPIVIGAYSTVTKGMVEGLEDLEITGRVEPSKLLHYWDRPDYWEDSWRLEETCCHSNSSEKQSSYFGVKKFQSSKIIIMIIMILRPKIL